MRQVHIFFKISNARQCLFPCFVRVVNPCCVNLKLFKNFAADVSGVSLKVSCKIFRRISGSQIGSQLLQNTEIIKQTDVLLWNIWRIYGSVSYLFSCIKIIKLQIFTVGYDENTALICLDYNLVVVNNFIITYFLRNLDSPILKTKYFFLIFLLNDFAARKVLIFYPKLFRPTERKKIIKSVHFKKTVAWSSFLSKLW